MVKVKVRVRVSVKVREMRGSTAKHLKQGVQKLILRQILKSILVKTGDVHW